MDRYSNRIIKGYELRERVGAGGFGAVYRAHQVSVGRDVAVKVILPERANEIEFIRRFEVEAQLIARLEHPHIVPLYDYWREPEGAFLVMRWLPGNLRTSIERGHWSMDAAARLLEQIAAALGIAHREGIIHRDIKPDNILLDEDDNAYLADFGIAKNLGERAITAEGTIVGSLAYLSPEQIRGEPLTPRTDIYSLGLVAYEVLTSEKPFADASTPGELITKHLNSPLPPLSLRRPNLPAAVNEALQTATAKDPLHRYASAVRFAAAFRAAAPVLHRGPAQPLVDPLTDRELEILHLIAGGLSNKDMAAKLHLSGSTVKWYINQIYSKLDAHSRHQAIDRARQLNLLQEPAEESQPTSVLPRAVTLEKPGASTPPGTHVSRVAFELVNPYKGLRAFQEADASDFFGRAALTEQLLARLAEGGDSTRFLAVVGTSGSGKSSVVRAGLVPALRRGALTHSERWLVTDMLPGTHPFEELEAALLRIAVHPLPDLLNQLLEDRRGLVRIVKRLLPADQEVELVLVIDQFEELFTLVADESNRMHFVDVLLSAATDPRSRLRLIVTLRADFYDRPLHYPRLAELMRSHTEVVIPFTEQELERAIAGPAERAGLILEAGLVKTIINHVVRQPGTLPLLQYTLTELFEQQIDGKLTLGAYEEMGGISGSLVRRADELYESLDSDEQLAARQLFLRLVTLGEGTEDTRRRTLQAELLLTVGSERGLEDMLNTFGQYRLLTFDRDPVTRDPTVEIAHEALIRNWARLREWLIEDRAGLRLHRHLTEAAQAWARLDRDPGELYRGARLIQASEWAEVHREALNPLEWEFLQASQTLARQVEAAREAQQQRELEAAQKLAEAEALRAEIQARANRGLRLLAAGLVIFLVAALISAFLALQQTARVEDQNRLATARELAAAAVNNLNADPQRSLLLALRAVMTTYSRDGTLTAEAEEALHRAVGVAQPQHILQGHSGSIYDVAYSPDGKRVATASLDGTAKVWDAETGKELLTLREPNTQVATSGPVSSSNERTQEVFTVAFSPDGKQLATGSRGGSVVVWDALTGKAQVTFHANADEYLTDHPLDVTSVNFSPDGTQLAMVAADMFLGPKVWEVKVWKLPYGEVTFRFSSSANNLVAYEFGLLWGDVAFSPDGTLLAVATSNDVKIWDFANNREVLTLTGHTRVVVDMIFSPDGKRLATVSDDGTAKLWDVALPLSLGATTTREQFSVIGRYSVALSPDGERLATASDDGTTNIWSAASGILTFSLPGHVGSVRGVTFSPDGTHIVTVGTDKTARLWEASPGKELFTLSFGVNTGGEVAYYPEGTYISTSGEDTRVVSWDASTGQALSMFSLHEHGQIVYSPDGTRFATTGGSGGIWDVATSKELFKLTEDANAGFDAIAYSPDGTRLATGTIYNKVQLWDAATGKELVTLTGHTGGVHCMAYSPDGKHLATGGDDKVVFIWDLTNNQHIYTLPLQGDIITSISYSPDGKRLVVSNVSDTASVWDAATGKLVTTLSGHPGAIVNAIFSPDGKRLATAGGTVVKLWDAVTYQELLTLYGHTAQLTSGPSMAFSPDGRYLANSAMDNTTRVYVLSLDELLTIAQSRVTRAFTEEECKKYLHMETCPTNQK